MANRALILYASSTGNTEKLALVFRDVLTEYGWGLELVHLDEDTDLPGQGLYLRWSPGIWLWWMWIRLGSTAIS